MRARARVYYRCEDHGEGQDGCGDHRRGDLEDYMVMDAHVIGALLVR